MPSDGLDPAYMDALRKRFAGLDRNGDYKLSFAEMSSMLREGNPHFSERELRALYSAIDRNHDGAVAFDEFVNFLYQPLEYVNDATISSNREPWRPSASNASRSGRSADNASRGESRHGADSTSRGDSRHGNRGGSQSGYCDWCRQPLSREVENTRYRTRRDGSKVKTTTTEFITDEQVSLRLPGVDETVTLHANTDCQAEYIEAHALRCEVCAGPIRDRLVVVTDETGRRHNLHAECQAEFEDAPMDDMGRGGGGAERRSPSGGGGGRSSSMVRTRDGASPARGGSISPNPGGRASPSRGGHRLSASRSQESTTRHHGDAAHCYQCGRPFRRLGSSASTWASTYQRDFGASGSLPTTHEAKTTLQLPGLDEAVVLCTGGTCIAEYTEENALRCDHCGRPITDDLKMLVLPWSDMQAILHEHCARPYSEANATTCARCRRPIIEEGVKVRNGGRVSYLHAACDSRY